MFNSRLIHIFFGIFLLLQGLFFLIGAFPSYPFLAIVAVFNFMCSVFHFLYNRKPKQENSKKKEFKNSEDEETINDEIKIEAQPEIKNDDKTIAGEENVIIDDTFNNEMFINRDSRLPLTEHLESNNVTKDETIQLDNNTNLEDSGIKKRTFTKTVSKKQIN